jgi:predicted transposase YdaD
LLAVTWVLAGTRFKDAGLLQGLMRRDAVIESPVLQELVAELTVDIERKAEERGVEKGRQEGRQEGIREGQVQAAQADVLEVLEVRFGAVPAEVAAQVGRIAETQRLQHLHRQAILCPDLAAFQADLPA